MQRVLHQRPKGAKARGRNMHCPAMPALRGHASPEFGRVFWSFPARTGFNAGHYGVAVQFRQVAAGVSRRPFRGSIQPRRADPGMKSVFRLAARRTICPRGLPAGLRAGE